MNKPSDIRLINLSSYFRPKVVESNMNDWVLNGKNNVFYKYIIDRYNGSPTNAAIINSYIDIIIGRGLTNKNTNIDDWLKFKSMLSDDDIKKVVTDYVMFGEFGFQIIKKRQTKYLPSIYHIEIQNTAPKKKDEKGIINGYYYSKDWSKIYQNKPLYLPIIKNDKNKKTECYVVKQYKAGREYFSDPDYIAGMPYAVMEEEIANYYVSHIKNGLSFGYIINIPDGNSYTEEEKEQLETKIKKKLTGSSSAGKFIINFNGRDAEITVTPLVVNSAHKQWEYLTQEARQQLLTSHRVTSPMLFGVKDNTGLGNNANELDVAEAQLMKRVIAPKQKVITDSLEKLANIYALNLDLAFLPITDSKNIMTDAVKLSEQEKTLQSIINNTADALIEMGEIIDEKDYELIETREAVNDTLTENRILAVLNLAHISHPKKNLIERLINFAKVPKSSPNKASEQDTSLFKVRYEYAGNPNPQREFCRKLMSAKKTYRAEDIKKASNMVVNKGFGLHGADTYDIFKYKGGVNCKHFWQRKIYLKKNNKRIGVNQARKLILELDPKDRPAAKWEQNPKEVAVIASPSNNYWRAEK